MRKVKIIRSSQLGSISVALHLKSYKFNRNSSTNSLLILFKFHDLRLNHSTNEKFALVGIGTRAQVLSQLPFTDKTKLPSQLPTIFKVYLTMSSPYTFPDYFTNFHKLIHVCKMKGNLNYVEWLWNGILLNPGVHCSHFHQVFLYKFDSLRYTRHVLFIKRKAK